MKFLLVFVFSVALVSLGSAQASTYSVQSFPGKITVSVDPFDMSQEPRRYDVLFVLDNSGSMTNHQRVLRERAATFLQVMEQRKIDYQVGVLTTTDWDFGKNHGLIVTPQTPDKENVLEDSLDVGISGSAEEQPLKAISSFLNAKSSFLRKNAGLVLIIITDAEDYSAINEDDLAQTLAKEFHPLQSFLAYADRASGCQMDDPTQEPERLMRFSQKLNAKKTTICNSNLTREIEGFLQSLPVPDVGPLEIPLPSLPVVSSIRASYGSLNFAPGDLERGWVYRATDNKVIFGHLVNWSTQPLKTLLNVDYVPQN